MTLCVKKLVFQWVKTPARYLKISQINQILQINLRKINFHLLHPVTIRPSKWFISN